MTMSPMAMGILVVPTLNLFIKRGKYGKIYPIPTPKSMAKKIQRVRYWSKKDNCFFMA
jgi:hypothetical protein